MLHYYPPRAYYTQTFYNLSETTAINYTYLVILTLVTLPLTLTHAFFKGLLFASVIPDSGANICNFAAILRCSVRWNWFSRRMDAVVSLPMTQPRQNNYEQIHELFMSKSSTNFHEMCMKSS